MQVTPPPKRPQLLTVLCILSFIYAGVLLYNGVANAFTDQPRRSLEVAKAQYEDLIERMGPEEAAKHPVAQFVKSSVQLGERVVEHAKPMGYTSISVAVVSALGTGLMWRRKRIGFALYLLSIVASAMAKAVFLGGGSLLASVYAIVSVLVGVVFVVLYATQLKHMR